MEWYVVVQLLLAASAAAIGIRAAAEARLGRLLAAILSRPLETSKLDLNAPPPQHKESVTGDKIRGGSPDPRKPKVVVLHPAFKLVFLTVTAITVLSIIAQIALANYWLTPTANQQQVFDALGFAWKTGIGAIVGLLGGKVV
jgi:hypothetical protein